MNRLPYDRSDPYSIETYAKRLHNISLSDCEIDTSILETVLKRKGSLGQIIEEFYFLYKPNSIAGPDFPEAGLELKTSPLLEDKFLKFKAKERLVFNIINYEEEYQKEFTQSSFWKKNQLLLLMFFLYEKEKLDIEQIFKIITLFRFPAVDLKIIKDDWEKIRNKIRAGLAHEISEGDTFYLGACTKGVNKDSTRKQPFSSVLAKQRAYSLKPKYLNIIIQKALKGEVQLKDETEDYQRILGSSSVQDPLLRYSTKTKDGNLSPIVKVIDDYKTGETIEQLIQRLFEGYYNFTENDLFAHLHMPKTKAKNRYFILAKAILGVNGKKIEEFEKADIQMKTIILEESGRLKESMSFPQIKYQEIIKEEWEDSEFFEQITKRFFFVVYKRNANREPVLKKVMFWNMPNSDLKKMEFLWRDTQSKIINGDFSNFIRISDNRIGHVRPKAKNASDLMLTHLGTLEKKKSFWLNSEYILQIIS